MERIIFHVDVNNAFLSWTAIYLLKNGYKKDIRTIPSVIGGDEKLRHGIVLAKSPIAKKYGIVTAETLYSARKKCHNLQVFSPNYTFYKEQSKKLYNYLSSYTPNIEQYSIDECFLDLTGTKLLYGNDYLGLANKIKNDIKQKFGFTVNVGIGSNKLCAKMASDFEKPDKVHTLYANEIKEKLLPLPVNDLFMVGKSTANTLKSLSIHTIGDLAKANSELLRKHFKNQADYLKRASLGIDDSIVESRKDQNKCLSVSRTLPYDHTNKEELIKVLKEEVEELSFTLRKKKLYTKSIAITYKNYLFKSYSHQLTLLNPICSTNEIEKQVIFLLNQSFREEPIRNIGIRFSDLTTSYEEQLYLFEPTTKKEDDIEKIMDELINKFGKNIIMRASKK